MRNSFVNTLIERARVDDRVALLMAEVGFSVVEPFENEFPDRFYNTGIAEQDLVLTAAGMALRGMRPVAYSMSCFLASRAFEQIKVSVCYQNLPVILVSVGSGLSYGNMGSTHHAIEESAILRSLPNIKVLYPSNKYEMKQALEMAFADNCPYYISFPKAPSPEIDNYKIELGKAVLHRTGEDAAILAFGYSVNHAVEVSDILAQQGIHVGVYGFHTVKPLDRQAIAKACKTGRIYILDEHNYGAGIGAEVARVILEDELPVPKYTEISIPEQFETVVYNYDEMLDRYGLSVKRLVERLSVECKKD